jgi:predicted glycogen debranching enzyme
VIQVIINDFNAALQREWLETNGLGGFASSTVIGLNTRRYHGLLVAATHPPVGRMVLLSKLEESLVIDGQRYELSTNQYVGAIHPQGSQYLKEFRLDPFPIFIYEVQGVRLEKSVLMIHGENTVIVKYAADRRSLDGVNELRLETRPLIAFRDYHSTTHENSALDPRLEIETDLISMTPYSDLPALFLAHNGSAVEPAGYWYRNFEFQVERDRGLDFKEDLFNPCVITFNLLESPEATLVASTEPRNARHAKDLEKGEIERRRKIAAVASEKGALIQSLVVAADQFIVERGEQKTVIAGYHWFGDWGRDTMIALPGLTLTTGREEIAKSILLAFTRFIDRGMLPNRFPDVGEQPEYNTVDATLWYFEAIRALLQKNGDLHFVRANLYSALKEIIEWHQRGTRYGICVDEDGLLHSGEAGVQLTWMDAKVGDWVVTPRTGKAVEIQALWYNALRFMKRLAGAFGDQTDEKRYSEMAQKTNLSFNRLFWNDDTNSLFDVVDGEIRDGSIRPNQIFAVSLSQTMLSPERARQVVETVDRELLTPVGLRSLSPRDPQYRGRYQGGPLERDGAYHQGTVWPWLMGPFITAYCKVNDRSRESLDRAAQLLEAFSSHLNDAGLGQISEVFDGDAPHHPGGCIAQAWSVAELLRAAEEVGEARRQEAEGGGGRQEAGGG